MSLIRGKNKTIMSEIQIWTFENSMGGINFQKCLNSKLLSDPIQKKKNQNIYFQFFLFFPPKRKVVWYYLAHTTYFK